MYRLRKDWEKLDKARELLESGPLDRLKTQEARKVVELLDKIEVVIKDELSVKELSALNKN